METNYGLELNLLIKRFISAFLCLLMVISLMPVSAEGASPLPNELFLEQESTGGCTLASSAMMIRGRLYLGGSDSWPKVTENAIRPYAWVSQGLLWNWNYTVDGITVSVGHESVSGISMEALKALLDEHPEGIVLHCKSVPHSVLLTDYEGDDFFCADSSSWYCGKRVRLDESYLGSQLGKQDVILRNVSAYWYVTGCYGSTPNNPTMEARYYTITYHPNGGEKAPSDTFAYPGDGGTLHVQIPECSGFTFLGWSEDPHATVPTYYPNGEIQTNSDLTLYAVWQKNPYSEDIRPFLDIWPIEYFYDSVLWAVNMGITAGTSPVRFSPQQPCTRAQAVTFLYRAAGMPSESFEAGKFTDVSADAYYADAVAWAVADGITEGTSPTTFSPDAPCTRAQIVTFLHRFMGNPQSDSQNPFLDVPADSYYRDAVLWAVEQDITFGTSYNSFSPNETCTRCQIVTFLDRTMN